MKWIMIALVLSNGFFIYQTLFWQRQAVEQIVTTSYVEELFKKASCHIDTGGVETLNSTSPEYAKRIDLSQDKQEFYSKNNDYTAYSVGAGHTLLIFKQGSYVGSRLQDVPEFGPWLLKLVNF